MVKTTYEPATDLDFFKMYGCYLADEWKCMAVKTGSYILGMGGYTKARDGVVYCFIDIGSPMARTPILYRRARRFIDEMKRDGIKKAYTICDDSKPNAERFLLRLGFKPTNKIHDNLRLWAIWLHYPT